MVDFSIGASVQAMDHERCGLLYVQAPFAFTPIFAELERRGLLVGLQRGHGSERASGLFQVRNVYHDLPNHCTRDGRKREVVRLQARSIYIGLCISKHGHMY
jgi:hypothetical protein